MNDIESRDKMKIAQEISFNVSLGNRFAYLFERQLESEDWVNLISWLKQACYQVSIDDYGSWKVLKILW